MFKQGTDGNTTLAILYVLPLVFRLPLLLCDMRRLLIILRVPWIEPVADLFILYLKVKRGTAGVQARLE